MSEIREIWSLPWHVMQRNLAEGIGVQRTDADGAAREAADSHTVKCADGSWLVRARRLPALSGKSKG
jgi:hypothetical protein